jgi:hypothetical protein
MSVVEPERHKGRLEVHVKAQALAAYTALIVKNPKVFDPEVDEDLIKRIKSYSMDIYEKAWAANKINAETNQINRAMRYQLQEEALLCCDWLHADIGIAKSVFHLRKRRMKYWSGLITEVRALLQAWKESDVKRYGQP